MKKYYLCEKAVYKRYCHCYGKIEERLEAVKGESFYERTQELNPEEVAVEYLKLNGSICIDGKFYKINSICPDLKGNVYVCIDKKKVLEDEETARTLEEATKEKEQYEKQQLIYEAREKHLEPFRRELDEFKEHYRGWQFWKKPEYNALRNRLRQEYANFNLEEVAIANEQ